MQQKQADMTPLAHLASAKGTGAFRSRRPVYVDLLPPCDNACPAGEHIQAWLALAQAGKFRAAWDALVRDNPLPAVHGRVCYHPCESACNRGAVDAAVEIHAVERYLGDLAAAENWPFPMDAPPSGKRVLIVGAGPSGLAAAYHLTRLDHAVEIRDAGPFTPVGTNRRSFHEMISEIRPVAFSRSSIPSVKPRSSTRKSPMILTRRSSSAS